MGLLLVLEFMHRKHVSAKRYFTVININTVYSVFAALYAAAGRSSQLNMVNSTWTKNHILQLWKRYFRKR